MYSKFRSNLIQIHVRLIPNLFQIYDQLMLHLPLCYINSKCVFSFLYAKSFKCIPSFSHKRILEKMTGIMSSGTKITGLGELEDNLHDDNEGTSSKRKSDGSDRGEDADAADDSKKKYRRVALKCHPDKMLSATESEKTAAETRFKAVNEANEVLSSEEKRKEYDFG
jgi:hypothetical protein